MEKESILVGVLIVNGLLLINVFPSIIDNELSGVVLGLGIILYVQGSLLMIR